MRKVLRSWKRAFFTIWSGQVIALLLGSVAQFAVIWWLAVQTGSPKVLALAAVMALLPQAVFSPFAGFLADRIGRKTAMILAGMVVAASGAG